MPTSDRAGAKAVALDAATEPFRERMIVRRSSQVRQDEQHAKTTRVAVVLSLFLVLLAAALLVGGRAVIDPMLRAAAQQREADQLGNIVLTMPDGAFCRHLSFDNKTAELTEGAIEQCTRDYHKMHTTGTMGFSWGKR